MLQTKKIVIADDDADDCLLFQDVLEDLNIKTDLVIIANGRQLLDYLFEKEDMPELIFLDMNMPLIDGMEALIEIRKCARLQNVPIVIFSTSSHNQIVIDVYKAGANLFIRKPDSFEKMRKILNDVFSQDLTIRPELKSFLVSE
jgi:CheY-like chemotaxis protein